MKNSQSGKRNIRLLSALMALLLIVSSFPVQATVNGGAETNSILYNGSFDLSYTDQQKVSGWNMNTKNTNHTAIIQKDVVYGDTGNALKIEAVGRSYIWATDFAVEPGATYILSYYIRVDSAEGLQYAPFLNDSNYGGGWWKDYVISPVTDVTQGWKKITGFVTIPKSVGENGNNPDCNVQLGFMVYTGAGCLYLDQVSFVKTEINLDDPNLNFEHQNVAAGTPLNWNSKSKGITLETDSAVYHDGGSSLYVQKDALQEKSFVESGVYLPVESQMIYEFSFWMCSQNADPTVTIQLDLQPYAADGTPVLQEDGSRARVYGTVSALNGGNQRSGWEKVVTRSAMPEGTSYVSLSFSLARGSVQLWIDDIFFNIVEDGIDCVVYYEDFHAVDEQGNISTWQKEGIGSFVAENGGKLTTVSTEGYVYSELDCLMTDDTYCLKGHYGADIGGTVQVRFYDYQHREYTDLRKTVPLQAGGTEFVVNFTAPSHTYAAIYIGSDQIGTITVTDVTVYMTAQRTEPNRNYLDADWTSRADRDNVVSSVEVYNGIPTLMIDGQPTAAHFYQRPDLNAYLQIDAESRIADSGLELYITYGGSLYKGGCDPIWLEDGSIDYAAFDTVIYDTLAASEDALVMVNFGMFAPKWWLEQNPDHVLLCHNGSQYIAIADEVSLASEKFRQEAGEVLRQLISHMKRQPYYNRVFGLKISGGQSYEWMIRGTGAEQGPDYSKVSQEGFKTYLQKKYITQEALRTAWGNDQVTFETATAPGWDERCASSNVYMGEGSTGSLSRNMVDWNLWLNEASADSFLYFCQIAKEETDNQIIVGGYNGYLWTSNTFDSQGMAHTAMDRVLDSPYVDWIASPIAYNERLLGQSSTYMALLDSVQAHGKIYIAEQDNRTCLSDRYCETSWDAMWDYNIGQTRTMADTIYQQKRDFANALINGAGLWQFDMYGGWLDDDQIYDYIRDAKAEYDFSVNLNRNTTNEVAVFVGDESYAYLTAENGNMSFTLLEPMLQQQRKHLAAMGAGYDTYAMSTLLEGKVPSHKLNIILSPFEITEQMQTAIDTYLKTDNQVVVWVYLPGISTGTELSLDNVKQATGFEIGLTERKSTLQVQIADRAHPLTAGITGLVYGNSVENSVSPLAYIQNTGDMTVLGYHMDGGKPGLAVKDMGNWVSVYSAAPCLDVQLLRNLMDFAGCHSYSENPADIIYSSNCYVALHSASAGEKTITLPGNYSVYDVFEEKFISMNTNTITYFHQTDDTHIFRLMTPDTCAVVAGIGAGKGTLSAPGLTEVTPGQGYSLTATPETGYEIAGITVNGKPVLAENGVVQIDSVMENTSIEVAFCKQTLLDNKGLEMGTFGGSIAGNSGAAVVSDGNVHSGIYSLRLNHDGSCRDLVEMTVRMNAVSEDRVITVSFWAKTAQDATRALHVGAHFFTDQWTKTKASIYKAVYPDRNNWLEYTQTLTLPAGTAIFQYQFYTDTVNADVYIDDISITCDGEQMLINGGLERGNLTGNFTKTENTPEIIRSQVAYSGTYGAYLPGGSKVTVSTTSISLGNDSQIALSAWITGSAKYRIYNQQQLVAEGVWRGSSQWSQQRVNCNLPAGTQALQMEIIAENACYLDDFDVSVMPVQTAELSFMEIYSDGTWRLKADNIHLFTEDYYKIPVVIDGTQGYVIGHKMADMLCVYPSFFCVYGGNEPVVTFQIPKGAVLKPVSPDQNWAETAGECFRATNTVEVALKEGKIEKWNVSLGSDLTVNFYADIQADDFKKVQAVITVADQIQKIPITNDQYDAENQAYKFSVPVAAAQMSDEIWIQLLYNDICIFEESYTVLQYAQYVLADEQMEAYYPLVREMLHYGGAAQTYFDYHTDRLVSTGISNDVTEKIPSVAEQEMSVTGKIAGIQFYGASLLFQNKVAIRCYFDIAGNVESYSFSANAVDCEAVLKDGLCYVDLPGMNPQDWDQTMELTVCDAEGNQLVVSYSPLHYMIRMYEKGPESLKQLLQAMYNYHLVAEAICVAMD